jgi:hypothetical protein
VAQADGLADLLEAGARIGLQHLQDFPVYFVHKEFIPSIYLF